MHFKQIEIYKTAYWEKCFLCREITYFCQFSIKYFFYRNSEVNFLYIPWCTLNAYLVILFVRLFGETRYDFTKVVFFLQKTNCSWTWFSFKLFVCLFSSDVNSFVFVFFPQAVTLRTPHLRKVATSWSHSPNQTGTILKNIAKGMTLISCLWRHKTNMTSSLT